MCGSEVDDSEQKKRGAGKTTSLNAIPTGAQKQEYTYSIYPQSPNSQSGSLSTTYQTQIPNSFYPTQGSNQYYSTPNSAPDTNSAYPAQPQINLIPPPSSSQFVPLNFVPNPGYQTKYQILPTKSQNGNIQIALIPQQQAYQAPSFLQYPQLYPQPTQQINPQQSPLISSIHSQGQYNAAPNYQLPLGNPYLGNPYLGQPSSMLLLAQPNPSLYNNFLYQNPLQNLYNYYPTNTQTKYALYGQTQPSTEYEKGPVSQTIPKEDNEIVSSSHNTEYITPSENANYKNAYTSARSASYSKL